MYPFHFYLLASALLASISVRKKWYGIATFAILLFIWVLFSVAFNIPFIM